MNGHADDRVVQPPAAKCVMSHCPLLYHIRIVLAQALVETVGKAKPALMGISIAVLSAVVCVFIHFFHFAFPQVGIAVATSESSVCIVVDV